MTSINEIFRSFSPEYFERYAKSMPNTHRKVINAIVACRTDAVGVALYQCETCSASHQFYRSCGNRHCPTCQHHKTQQWLEKHLQRQLPTHHFLFTFTVPEKLRGFMRKNQRAAYSALFKTSSQAIKNWPRIQSISARICQAFSAGPWNATSALANRTDLEPAWPPPDDKPLADTLPCLASTSKLERSYSPAGRTQRHADQHLKNSEPLRFAHTV